MATLGGPVAFCGFDGAEIKDRDPTPGAKLSTDERIMSAASPSPKSRPGIRLEVIAKLTLSHAPQPTSRGATTIAQCLAQMGWWSPYPRLQTLANVPKPYRIQVVNVSTLCVRP